MHGKSRMRGQPRLHGGVFVRRVVISDQMQRLALGRLTVDLAQELEPLRVGVACLALADDLAVEHLHLALVGPA